MKYPSFHVVRADTPSTELNSVHRLARKREREYLCVDLELQERGSRREMAMKGSIMPIEFFMESVNTRSIRWRNLATGECRSAPPRVGELDWVEVTFGIHCPD